MRRRGPKSTLRERFERRGPCPEPTGTVGIFLDLVALEAIKWPLVGLNEHGIATNTCPGYHRPHRLARYRPGQRLVNPLFPAFNFKKYPSPDNAQG